LYIGANADYRQFSNSNNQQGLVSQYSVMDYSAALYGNFFDTIGGAGANNGSLILTSGYTNLSSSPMLYQSSVANANNAQGSFVKFRYSANRIQNIVDGLSLYASFSGQATNSNLDPSEMFYLGGAYGVRAYPTNEGAGSQAQLATIELRKTLPQNVGTAIFYDYGHLQVNSNNNFAYASALNSYAMKGAGLSLSWRPEASVDLKVIWAKRIGSNPNPTYTGTYQNGTSGNSQFWFTASVAF
jgi:hypothetical protein